MNENVKNLFIQWLKLNEDEKRDFIKELFYFNNLSPNEKISIEKQYTNLPKS
jgi:hypothetical protein